MNRACFLFPLFAIALIFPFLTHAQQTDSVTTTTNAPDVAPAAAATTPVAPSLDATPAPPVSPPAAPLVSPPTASAPAASQEEIDDIRPPFFFIHDWPWFWIALAMLAATLLVLLWILLKPHRQFSAKTAYELALEKLEKARTLLREDNPMPYAVLVSEAIRTYLGQRFQAPSNRRTTEEFLRQMESDRATPLAEHRDLLRNFLQSCDLVKFARYQPTLRELEEVQQRAFSFVTATKPVPAPGQRNGSRP